MDQPLIILDTETATFDGPPHLLELGAIRVLDGEVCDQFVSFVCPQVPIQLEASDFHGITEADVRAAPPLEEVLRGFSEWVGDDWMCAHSAPFDARVLAYEYARTGLEPPPGPFVDTLCLAKRYLPEAPDHKLATLTEYLELDVGTLHRALADAVSAWQVLEACCERYRAIAGVDATVPTLLADSGTHSTIGGATPEEPRLNQRTRPLGRAIQDGTGIRLQYGAPTAHAMALDVRPKLLFRSQKKSYLEAECLKTGILKTYRLDRIQRVSAL